MMRKSAVLSFSVMDIRYIWSFIIFLLVGFIAGGQTERLRKEADFARQHERRTRSLYEFSREIAAQVDLESIIRALAKSAAQALERSVVVLLPDEKNKLTLRAQENFGELKQALMQAYQGRGERVDHDDVPLAAVRAAGLDEAAARDVLQGDAYAAEVRADEQRWQQAGIQSVPAIVINGRHLISGGQPPEVFEQALRRAVAGELS